MKEILFCLFSYGEVKISNGSAFKKHIIVIFLLILQVYERVVNKYVSFYVFKESNIVKTLICVVETKNINYPIFDLKND
jgi:hypothetical protein